MIRFEVTLKRAEEVTALRARITALEGQLVDAQTRINQLEYRFRCEVIVNAELVDLCRASGVVYRPSIDARSK